MLRWAHFRLNLNGQDENITNILAEETNLINTFKIHHDYLINKNPHIYFKSLIVVAKTITTHTKYARKKDKSGKPPNLILI